LVSDLSKTKLNSKVPAGKWQIERSLNGAPIARKKIEAYCHKNYFNIYARTKTHLKARVHIEHKANLQR
jgi:hypothetical protein